jgi:hypothetical protein
MRRRQLVWGIAVSAATLGLASATWQKAGERRDRRRYPPSGRLAEVGGHRLHIVCAGECSPTVVVMACEEEARRN